MTRARLAGFLAWAAIAVSLALWLLAIVTPDDRYSWLLDIDGPATVLPIDADAAGRSGTLFGLATLPALLAVILSPWLVPRRGRWRVRGCAAAIVLLCMLSLAWRL